MQVGHCVLHIDLPRTFLGWTASGQTFLVEITKTPLFIPAAHVAFFSVRNTKRRTLGYDWLRLIRFKTQFTLMKKGSKKRKDDRVD